MPLDRRQTRAAAAVAAVLLLGAPLASSSVRAKLAGAYRGFVDPQSTTPASSVAPPAAEDEPLEPAAAEQVELEGDFSLADPEAPETFALGGVVTTLTDLPIAITQRTLRYVEHFGTDPEGREQFFVRQRRAARFREHIEESLRYAGFPEDLVWLAAIESGFVPQATSPKGAVGLFQIMPETAERFGLTISEDVDERRSVPRSTEAALAYLAFLHEKFGTWDLALAAYNCGEGRLDEALGKARERLGRGPEEDVAFHEVASLKLLPKETADFVPKIHAFAIVAHNAEALALDDLDPLPAMRFAQIAVPAGTKLATVAHAAGISVAALREHNPEFLSERVPDAKSDVLVNVSPDVLAQALAALPTYLAKEEPPPAPAAEVLGATKSTTKGEAKSSSSGSASTAKPEKPVVSSAPKPKLKPAPMRPGAFVLSSGVIVEIKKDDAAAEVTLSARVEVVDPLKGRTPIPGATFKLEERRVAPAELTKGLDAAKRDLRALVLAEPAAKLRTTLSDKRRAMHQKALSAGPFLELSQRVFPKGHPMEGSVLVGPTEPADDMFLEPEPVWALETVVTLSGPVDAELLAGDLEAAFADTFIPLRAATLAKSSRATVGKGERRILIGWSSAPPTAKTDTAHHLAFMLACHNKLGRFHRALRHDKPMTGRLNCSLELAPHAAVAWVFAMPSMPHTNADIESTVDASIASLIADGPTDQELTAARGLLRAELARERESATLRSLPKSWVAARNDAILGGFDGADKKAIVESVKVLFSKDRRVVVVSD